MEEYHNKRYSPRRKIDWRYLRSGRAGVDNRQSRVRQVDWDICGGPWIIDCPSELSISGLWPAAGSKPQLFIYRHSWGFPPQLSSQSHTLIGIINTCSHPLHFTSRLNSSPTLQSRICGLFRGLGGRQKSACKNVWGIFRTRKATLWKMLVSLFTEIWKQWSRTW